MIRLFSKLRHIDLKNRNFLRYLQYAVGEVILIIIGIMIALYLDDWNNRREKEAAFNIAATQVYQALQEELDWYELMISSYEIQSEIAQKELNKEIVLFNPAKTVGYLNSIAQGFRNLVNEPLLARLNENITSPDQTLLVNDISTYASTWENWDKIIEGFQIQFLSDLIEEYDLPFIDNYMLFYRRPYQNTEYDFSEEEIEKAEALRAHPSYRTRIKSIVHRNMDLTARYRTKTDEIQSMMALIHSYDPSIRITYKDMGILGSATTHGWDSSIPMTLKDPDKRIWGIRIQLKDGEVKFRDGDTWDDNWGATYSRDGRLMESGLNIPVKEGMYDVKINMTDKTYSLSETQDTGGN